MKSTNDRLWIHDRMVIECTCWTLQSGFRQKRQVC